MAQEPNQNQLDIKNPHDLLFKRSFRIKKVMEDFLRGRLATDLLQQVDLTTLQLENSSFVEEKMRESTSDLVYSLKIQGQSGYMYVLMEAQSTYDELLHVRLLEYNAKLMRQHVEQGKGTKLPVIINVVLYTGTKPYKEGDSLIEYFENPALFYQMMERPFLIPLNKNSAGQILGDGDAALTELLLKQGKQREFCKFIEEYGGEIQLLVYHSSYRVTALLYMCAMDEHLPAEIRKIS